MNKLINLISLSFFFGSLSNAWALTSSTTFQQLTKRAQDLTKMIHSNPHLLTTPKVMRLHELISEAEGVLQGLVPPTGPGPFSPQSSPAVYYQAECHIDDDPEFSPNQSGIRIVVGYGISQVLSQCRDISNSLYGLKKVIILEAPPYFVQADCHIDDDPEVTPDQYVVGKLTGFDFADVARQCAEIADNTYGRERASSIIRKPTWTQEVSILATADCEIDDDVKFNWGQIPFGKIRGRDLMSLEAQCLRIAKITYKGKGSARTRNFVPGKQGPPPPGFPGWSPTAPLGPSHPGSPAGGMAPPGYYEFHPYPQNGIQ